MSDEVEMLACFGYFLSHLGLYLTKIRQTKVAQDDLATGSIGFISAKSIFV